MKYDDLREALAKALFLESVDSYEVPNWETCTTRDMWRRDADVVIGVCRKAVLAQFFLPKHPKDTRTLHDRIRDLMTAPETITENQ